MRYVRCEACGSKALLAASQCPKCGHLLGLRDTRGNPVPLSHCRGCDSYYLSSSGACRWCGPTAPRGVRLAPFLWIIGIAIAGAAAVGAGAWGLAWYRADASTMTENVPAGQTTDVSQIPTAGEALSVTNAAADSAAAPAVAANPDTPTSVADTGIQAPAGDSSLAEIRWITATAITWANVRSAPSREAGIVAVISPDMRVRLGDVQDGWHRVKAGGIEGWVDRRFFSVGDPSRAR